MAPWVTVLTIIAAFASIIQFLMYLFDLRGGRRSYHADLNDYFVCQRFNSRHNQLFRGAVAVLEDGPAIFETECPFHQLVL